MHEPNKLRWRVAHLRLAYPMRIGRQSRSETLSCRRDCGTVELGCDFHAHDFEQHANAPAVVQMRETTKGLGEWSRQYAHFLADLEIVLKANGPTAFT
jgi:hypothetical protein